MWSLIVIAKNASGEAVIICPGGGYGILAYDWEGEDIAKHIENRNEKQYSKLKADGKQVAAKVKDAIAGSKSRVLCHHTTATTNAIKSKINSKLVIKML